MEKNREDADTIKSEYGLEIVPNRLSSSELIEDGYKKINISEISYINTLFEFVPQFITDKINSDAVQKSFTEALENSYKCILDPSRHLATIKGTKDVYIGAALDNESNQVVGQARWLKNDEQLVVPKVPNIVLDVFNALSIITGQYFMSQVNEQLADIKSGIEGIQEYLEAKKESELETAFQELSEILNHLKFIKKDIERVRNEITRLNGICKKAIETINLQKKQIDAIIKISSLSDTEKNITDNLNETGKYLIQYRFAVYIYNLAYIVKIYLSNITDIEELKLCRNELSEIVHQYKAFFEKRTIWSEKYLNNSKVLNDMSVMQIVVSFGVGATMALCGGKYSSYKAGSQAASLVNELFDKNRKKKKDKIVLSHKEYKMHMEDMNIVESTIVFMDNYIETSHKVAEIVFCDGEYYIKYLDEIEKTDMKENK